MKYAMVLRKLVIDGTIYYQAFDKVIGEETFNNKIKVIEGEAYLDKELPSLEDKRSQLVYMEIDETTYFNMDFEEFIFFKKENNDITAVNDPVEYNNLALAFHERYRDFKIIPEYNIEKLLKDVKDDLKNKLLGQDEPINKILRKIYDNHMYFESDLDEDNIYKNKNNIMIMGEFGTGKTTIIDSINKNLVPIPVLNFTLTGNLQEDIGEIIRKLWILSGGNKFLAERGIVIFDSIESVGEFDKDGEVISHIQELEVLMKSKEVYLKNGNDVVRFNTSFITYILVLDKQYDFKEPAEYDDLYYSKIYGKRLAELGFTLNMIDTLFNNEVIFMNEMTPELATEIIKNKEMSPLYKMKQVLEGRGKKVRISKDFVMALVDYSLDFNNGFAGIERTLKYILDAKDLSKKEVYFTEDDIFNLKVGTANLLHDELYDEYNSELDNEVSVKTDIKTNKKNNDKVKDIVSVDLKNRTINGLKIPDVVNMIKQHVKGQDDAIFNVVNSFYNHIFNRHRGYTAEEIRELKENVLLLGPTGVGKTQIVRTLANIFDIPYVREIATRYSKTGFQGENVDSMLYDLVDAAGGDVTKAQLGVIYIDEIDKIKSQVGKDEYGMQESIQFALLTLIEGDKRTIESTLSRNKLEFDTSNLWFIGTGTFDGLDDNIKERLRKEQGLGKVGFSKYGSELKVLPKPTDDDLHAYGFDRQFLGRFPNKIQLSNLDVDTLYDIINNPNGGIVSLTKKGYESDGITISMSDEFKKALAKRAYDKKQGARGIKSAFVDIKNTIDKNIENGDVEEIILDENSVDNPKNIVFVKRKNR